MTAEDEAASVAVEPLETKFLVRFWLLSTFLVTFTLVFELRLLWNTFRVDLSTTRLLLFWVVFLATFPDEELMLTRLDELADERVCDRELEAELDFVFVAALVRLELRELDFEELRLWDFADALDLELAAKVDLAEVLEFELELDFDRELDFELDFELAPELLLADRSCRSSSCSEQDSTRMS